MGVGKQANLVYLINFGLSKEYRDSNTHAHVPFKKDLGPVGTAIFMSINSHLGMVIRSVERSANRRIRVRQELI